jgi:hypothetical protein
MPEFHDGMASKQKVFLGTPIVQPNFNCPSLTGQIAIKVAQITKGQA